MEERIEQKLFDLIETKSFGELSLEEKAFVREHFSEEEFELHRKIQSEAGDIDLVAVPRPLILEKRKPIGMLIFTSVGSAAAAVLIMMMLLPKASDGFTYNLNVSEGKIMKDTVVVENIIRDTVVRQIVVEKKITVQSPVANAYQLDAYDGSAPEFELRVSEIANKGESAARDQAFREVRKVSFVGM